MNSIVKCASHVRIWLWLWVLAALVINIAHAEETPKDALAVTVYKDVYSDYERFVRGRPIVDINYYGGPGARRDVIEMVLLQQALLRGGFTDPLTFRDEQTYLRTLRQIADGRFIASGSLVWYSNVLDSPDLFHISQPIVEEGKFIVGIYVSADNQQALNTRNLNDLRALRAVTTTQWEADIALLKSLGIKQVYHTDDWVHIVRMLNVGRAD